MHIDDVLPEHFASSYPKFITLLERYYEWQNQYDATELLNHLFASRDITETDLTLLNFIEDELLLGGSYFEGSGDKRAAANFSSTLFRAKGSKYSIEWFFRSFFQLDPEVIYPKENIFLIAKQDKPESFTSKIGPDSIRYLTNDRLYQTFAILVRAGIPVNEWKKLFKLFVHPAGMYLGGEVLLEGEASLGLTNDQVNAVVDPHQPHIELIPNTNTTAEGVSVTYSVSSNSHAYQGDYRYYVTHNSTEPEDFVDPPYQLYRVVVQASSIQDADEQFTEAINQNPLNSQFKNYIGKTILIGTLSTGNNATNTPSFQDFDIQQVIDSTPTGVLAESDPDPERVFSTLPRGSYIERVGVIGSDNYITLNDTLVENTATKKFLITGAWRPDPDNPGVVEGWQPFYVDVKTEMTYNSAGAGNEFVGITPPADISTKVYDTPITPNSDQITFEFINDYFLDGTETGENLGNTEQYTINIMDWSRSPFREVLSSQPFQIANVWWDVSTATQTSGFNSFQELGTALTVTINGYNLPSVATTDPIPVRWFIEHITTVDLDFEVVPPTSLANAQSVEVTGGTGYIANAGTFTITPKKDYHTEGEQAFRIHLYGPGIDENGDSVLMNYFHEVRFGNGASATPGGKYHILDDTSTYPQYVTGDQTVTEGNDIVINVSTISGTPNSGDGSEHNPNGDYFYDYNTESYTTDGVLWEILDDLDGRITTLTGREPFSAASTNLTMSTTTADGYYRGQQTATVRVTNHDDGHVAGYPAQISTGTITMNDAAVSDPVISGPASITEGAASGSWSFTHKNSVPGTNYYWWVDGLDDADFTSTPPRTGSRGVLTTDTTANSVIAGGDTMIMTSTMDLSAYLDALTEGTESFTIKVSDSNTNAANEIASFSVDIVDVVPEYTVSSNTPVTEGNDIVLSLAVVNPVPEDVNVTVADDGSGRYTAGAYTFTAPNYNDITIATTLDPAIQNALGASIDVTVTGATSGQTDSTTVVLNDLVPIYEVITSQASYVEGDTIVVGLNVTNSVGENVDLAISDDGTGRYSTAGDTFIWTGLSYGNLNIPTSINAGIDNPQTITLTVTGQSSGVQDTVTFDLTDLLPTYSLTIRNTSNTSITTLVEGGTIRLDLGVTDTVGEDVDWSVSPADARLSATSGTFSSPGYVDIDITTSAPTTFENDPVLTFTVTGQSSGVQASDTLTLQDGPADITYTLTAPAGNVTEGDAWSFTVIASLTNTGTYEDFDWSITGDARVNATGQITAADFVTGSGTVTVNRTSTSDPVYQGPTTITVDGTGATYSNTASDTFSLVDEAGSLNSVTGLDSLNDGGTGTNYTFAITPNTISGDGTSAPYEGSAGFSLLSTGDMNVLGDTVNPALGADNWVTAADQAAGFGNDYQVQVISYSSNPSGFGSGTVANSVYLSGSGSSSNNQGGSTSWDNGTGDWFRLNSTFTMALFILSDASSYQTVTRYVDIEIKEFDGSNYGTGTTVLQKRITLFVEAGGGP